MEKSNITVRMNEKDVLGKLKTQLDDAQKTAGKVEQHLAEARSILLSYTRKNSNLQYTNFCDMVLESSRNSEKLTEKLRRLTLEVILDAQRYEDYKSDLVLIHGIELGCENGVLIVSMPVLVPHRKDSYTDYLYKPLHTACQHWCMKQMEMGLRAPAFTNCTVCFVHIYDETLPLGRVRDHDNYEEKHVLDVLSNFFLKSDRGLYVDTFHMTRLGRKDRTVIYVMDSCSFPEWISHFRADSPIEKNITISGQENDTSKAAGNAADKAVF